MKKWTKTALLTGCAGSGSDKSSDAKESYTIGIEQFAAEKHTRKRMI